jgi:hypothetical protein
MARINGLEPENVAEKCAVRFGVFTVNNYVSARNHSPLQRNTRNSRRLACSVDLADSIKLKYVVSSNELDPLSC